MTAAQTTERGKTMQDQPEIMDLNTAEGCAAWMKELPTENLREIAARPLDCFNALLVTAAEGELIVRAARPAPDVEAIYADLKLADRMTPGRTPWQTLRKRAEWIAEQS